MPARDLHPRPRALTFEQKVQAAHGHFVLGIAQHDIASMFGVNPGRVAEACTAVKAALTDKT